VQLSLAPVAATLLVAVRLGVVLFMTPLLGSLGVPARIRWFMTLSLAVMLTLSLGLEPAVDISNAAGLALAFAHELLWGALLGFGLLCAFAAFLFGGRLLDLQIGLGVASLLDPLTRGQTPLLGLLLQLAGASYFLAVDGHHAVLRVLALSLRSAPPGVSPAHLPLDAILVQFGLMFSLGVVLVSAAMICVFLVDIGMSIAARLLPQANIFILSMTVKVFAGIGVLALSIPAMQPVMSRIFATVFAYWESVLVR
jgi:flagellar biosynthetic protein FliR